MAIKSFTDTYVIERKDVNRFHDIVNSKKQIVVKEVKGHKDVKGKEMLVMLGINKHDL